VQKVVLDVKLASISKPMELQRAKGSLLSPQIQAESPVDAKDALNAVPRTNRRRNVWVQKVVWGEAPVSFLLLLAKLLASRLVRSSDRMSLRQRSL
jgi:hypothetical protein